MKRISFKPSINSYRCIEILGNWSNIFCNYSAFLELTTTPMPIQSRVYTGSCLKYLSLLYTQNWIFMYVAYPETRKNTLDNLTEFDALLKVAQNIFSKVWRSLPVALRLRSLSWPYLDLPVNPNLDIQDLYKAAPLFILRYFQMRQFLSKYQH